MATTQFDNKLYDVLVLGELLWDCDERTRTPAGAPFNFARNLQSLKLRPFFASAVGIDDGEELSRIVQATGMPNEIQINGIKTGRSIIKRRPRGHIFEIEKPAAWDAIALTDTIQEAADNASAIYFGTLAQRSEETCQTLRELIAQFNNRPRILDINLRAPYDDPEIIRWSLAHCDILKISSEEVNRVAQATLGMRLDNTGLLAEACFDRFKISTVIETRGIYGARAWDRTGDFTSFKPPLSPVKSTVGAGDAFTAAYVQAFINEIPLVGAIEYAVEYASDVISNKIIEEDEIL